MTTGHSRTRRLVTATERQERVSLRLSAALLPIFFDWYESDLQAGLLPFAAQVANLGPGVRWYEALMLRYTSSAAPGGITTIQAELTLRGHPYRSGP